MGEDEIQGTQGSFSYQSGPKKLYLVWWVVGVLIQVLLGLPFILKRINWRALWLTFIVFMAVMYISETIALYWGWWIWNENQLWGFKIGLVPLEEFLLCILVVPSLVTFQLIIQNLMDKIQRR